MNLSLGTFGYRTYLASVVLAYRSSNVSTNSVPFVRFDLTFDKNPEKSFRRGTELMHFLLCENISFVIIPNCFVTLRPNQLP